MPVMAVARFERLFHEVGGLTVDKDDLRRYTDFMNHKLSDFLFRGQAVARANGRDLIEPYDLPITVGLYRSMDDFVRIDADTELAPFLDELAEPPPLDLGYSDETSAAIPRVLGGLTVALARTFQVIDPGLKLPHREQWERVFRLFDLLL